MKNMKIGRKLAIGFGILLIFVAAITVLGVVSIVQVNRNYTYVLEHPNRRYSTLRDLEVGLMDLRRIITQVSFVSGNVPAIDALQTEFNNAYNNIRVAMTAYTGSLMSDGEIEPESRNFFLEQVGYLEHLIYDYLRHVTTPTFVAARADNFNQVSALLALNTTISNDIGTQFSAIFAETQIRMDSIGYETSAIAMGTVWVLVVLAVVALVLGIFTAVMITRACSHYFTAK